MCLPDVGCWMDFLDLCVYYDVCVCFITFVFLVLIRLSVEASELFFRIVMKNSLFFCKCGQ